MYEDPTFPSEGLRHFHGDSCGELGLKTLLETFDLSGTAMSDCRSGQGWCQGGQWGGIYASPMGRVMGVGNLWTGRALNLL